MITLRCEYDYITHPCDLGRLEKSIQKLHWSWTLVVVAYTSTSLVLLAFRLIGAGCTDGAWMTHGTGAALSHTAVHVQTTVIQALLQLANWMV
jgi:hypothetical protein